MSNSTYTAKQRNILKMETVVINITTEYDKALKESAKFLKNGEVVGIPTETVYGLAANALDENAVKSFFNSDVGSRLLASDEVLKEYEFAIFKNAKELYEDLPEIAKDEKIVVQGKLDCAFKEKDGFVLVDYKTDNVTNENYFVSVYKNQLEIYADDVKCSHGATIGRLNEEEQFYMRSRGISLEDAKVLQMISFIAPVLENIPDEAQREAVAAQFESDIRNIIRKA